MTSEKYRIGKTYISATNPEDAKKRIEEAALNGKGGYVCVSNPRTVVYASKHSDYLEVMKNSFMNIPDAEPMLWAAKLWGLKTVKRTMGPILFNDMLVNKENGLKHFLLGDTNETLKKLLEKYKDSNIVGSFSPPFCELSEYDYESIAKMINDSGAHLVWISMRAPKQDFFAARITPLLHNKICIGVGAAFRFTLGEYKMAPPIIKKLGLTGIYWGRKGKKWRSFICGYITNVLPFVFLLMAIPFKKLARKRYYE